MTPPGDRPAVLDTSVVIDLGDDRVRGALPPAVTLSVVTLAELAVGPLVTDDPVLRAHRQRQLADVEARFDPLPVDAAAARSFGLVVAAVRRTGRTSRLRSLDLLIAAVAHANGLPLVTRNPSDLEGLDGLVEVVPV